MYRKSFCTGGDFLYLEDILNGFLYHIDIQNYFKRTQKGDRNIVYRALFFANWALVLAKRQVWNGMQH